MKKSDNKDLDEAVFTWFKNASSENIPVNGIIIKEEALSLAKSLELTDFRASDGWLDNGSKDTMSLSKLFRRRERRNARNDSKLE